MPGSRGVVETADIVFTDDRRDEAKADAILSGIDGPLALVNVSGLIARSVDQVPEYVTLVDYLRADGFTVILLAPRPARHGGRPHRDAARCMRRPAMRESCSSTSSSHRRRSVRSRAVHR